MLRMSIVSSRFVYSGRFSEEVRSLKAALVFRDYWSDAVMSLSQGLSDGVLTLISMTSYLSDFVLDFGLVLVFVVKYAEAKGDAWYLTSWR